jgi:putative protease
LALLAKWDQELRARRPRLAQEDVSGMYPAMPQALPRKGVSRKIQDIRLLGFLPQGRDAKSGLKGGATQGLWLSPKALREVSRTLYSRISWWLPPVIWPDEEDQWSRLIRQAVRDGARSFVCNAPWQRAFFDQVNDLGLIAGPFCNIANALAIGQLARQGFEAVVISPELSGEDLLSLPGQSPLPLGITLTGFWPAGITRHKALGLKAQDSFSSPKGEEFWMRRYGENIWIYPAWPLDLTEHRPALEKAGYSLFVHMDERPPRTMTQTDRPGEFNWKIDIL